MITNKLNNTLKFVSSILPTFVAYLPTLVWMADRWMAKESYYGHGFLIPIVSLFIVWQRKEILKKIEVSSEIIGLWVIVACVITHIICAALKVYFISAFSFVFALYGLILFFFGKKMAHS